MHVRRPLLAVTGLALTALLAGCAGDDLAAEDEPTSSSGGGEGTSVVIGSQSFDEAMNYLSGLRLAVGLKLITDLSVYTLNKLLIFSQLAHLAHAEGRALTQSEGNLVRARYVRQVLATEAGSHG